jgi:MFS-type transporter involved in bile tolerance (Atg22 family)
MMLTDAIFYLSCIITLALSFGKGELDMEHVNISTFIGILAIHARVCAANKLGS